MQVPLGTYPSKLVFKFLELKTYLTYFELVLCRKIFFFFIYFERETKRWSDGEVKGECICDGWKRQNNWIWLFGWVLCLESQWIIICLKSAFQNSTSEGEGKMWRKVLKLMLYVTVESLKLDVKCVSCLKSKPMINLSYVDKIFSPIILEKNTTKKFNLYLPWHIYFQLFFISSKNP